MKSNKNYIAYALQYVSYLVHNLDEKEWQEIKEIILFGSVARGEAAKNSDIDLFINTFSENKHLEKAISYATKKFYDAEIFRHWKLLGVDNDIKPIVGVLDQWDQLKYSISINGLSLFCRYKTKIEGEQHVLIYWDKVKPESKRVLLSKRLYGYNYRTKTYPSQLKAAQGIKFASNCILVPIGNASKVLAIFKDLGIKHKVIYTNKA